jgi:hypothetical protein
MSSIQPAQITSISRQRPLLATIAECRAGTQLVEFDDRISELASNIDEGRRHRDLKLRAWTIERIRADAPGRLCDCGTVSLCELFLEQRRHSERGFRACLEVVRLARPYAAERLEAAAERAIDIGSRTYGSVKSILDNHLDRRSAKARHGRNADPARKYPWSALLQFGEPTLPKHPTYDPALRPRPAWHGQGSR